MDQIVREQRPVGDSEAQRDRRLMGNPSRLVMAAATMMPVATPAMH